MGRTKTVAEVPIQQTRCWTCIHLEKTVGINDDAGKVVKRYKCPKTKACQEMLPPYFAEKCGLYRPKA
jgi:hypothetical protein